MFVAAVLVVILILILAYIAYYLCSTKQRRVVVKDPASEIRIQKENNRIEREMIQQNLNNTEPLAVAQPSPEIQQQRQLLINRIKELQQIDAELDAVENEVKYLEKHAPTHNPEAPASKETKKYCNPPHCAPTKQCAQLYKDPETKEKTMRITAIMKKLEMAATQQEKNSIIKRNPNVLTNTFFNNKYKPYCIDPLITYRENHQKEFNQMAKAETAYVDALRKANGVPIPYDDPSCTTFTNTVKELCHTANFTLIPNPVSNTNA